MRVWLAHGRISSRATRILGPKIIATVAEVGKFDFPFFADGLLVAVGDHPGTIARWNRSIFDVGAMTY